MIVTAAIHKPKDMGLLAVVHLEEVVVVVAVVAVEWVMVGLAWVVRQETTSQVTLLYHHRRWQMVL